MCPPYPARRNHKAKRPRHTLVEGRRRDMPFVILESEFVLHIGEKNEVGGDGDTCGE